MRPLSLTFAGLRSYRQAATIDFADLDLFAVIGDTGAGKSTIIEALCLALYGSKSWSGGASITDLIADGEDVMRIEFTFAADDHTWTVTRVRRRSGGSPVDKLVSPSGGGPAVDGARPVTARVEELVGLDLTQFTRAVVMPQGRFDELLRAKPDKRGEILTSILGLADITEAGAKVKQLRDQLRPHHAVYTDRRSRYPADPSADVATAEAGLNTATARREELSDALAAVDGLIKTIDVVENYEPPLKDALARTDLPGDPLAALEECKVCAEELAARRSDAERRLSEVAIALDGVTQRAAEIRDGFEDRDSVVAAQTRLRVLAESLSEDLDALAVAAARVETLDREPPTGLVDKSITKQVEAAAGSLQLAEESLEKAQRDLTQATGAWDNLLSSRLAREALAEVLSASEHQVGDADTAAEAAERGASEAEDRVRDAVGSLHANEVADAVAHAAADCAPGDDCPICERPLPDDFIAPPGSDMEAARREVDALQQAADAARTNATNAAVALAGARTARDNAREAIAANEAEIERAEAACQRAGLDPAAPSTDSALSELRRAHAQVGTSVKDAETALQEAKEREIEARTRAEAAERHHIEQVETADRAVETAHSKVVRHVATVSELPASWRPPQITVDEISVDLVSDLVDRIDAAIEALSEVDDERLGFERDQLTAREEVAAIDLREAREVRGKAESILARVNQWIDCVREAEVSIIDAAGAGLVDQPRRELLDLLDTGLDVASLPDIIAIVRDRVDAGKRAITAAQRALDEIASRSSAGRAQVAEIIAGVGYESVDDLRTSHGAAAERFATAKADLERAEGDAGAVAEIEKVLATLSPFLFNLEVLDVALRKQHFVRHLVELREAELLAEASRRMREISNGRFGFISEFAIVNIASGETRTPDTLSGGERFQASLALALALVEIASRGGGRLDAVFVDEGFGSLDLNALDVALSTLGKVAGSGKMVALISHLRPVAEYVDTVLYVTRDDVLGSRIREIDSEERDRLLADDVRSGLMA